MEFDLRQYLSENKLMKEQQESDAEKLERWRKMQYEMAGVMGSRKEANDMVRLNEVDPKSIGTQIPPKTGENFPDGQPVFDFLQKIGIADEAEKLLDKFGIDISHRFYHDEINTGDSLKRFFLINSEKVDKGEFLSIRDWVEPYLEFVDEFYFKEHNDDTKVIHELDKQWELYIENVSFKPLVSSVNDIKSDPEYIDLDQALENRIKSAEEEAAQLSKYTEESSALEVIYDTVTDRISSLFNRATEYLKDVYNIITKNDTSSIKPQIYDPNDAIQDRVESSSKAFKVLARTMKEMAEEDDWYWLIALVGGIFGYKVVKGGKKDGEDYYMKRRGLKEQKNNSNELVSSIVSNIKSNFIGTELPKEDEEDVKTIMKRLDKALKNDEDLESVYKKDIIPAMKRTESLKNSDFISQIQRLTDEK